MTQHDMCRQNNGGRLSRSNTGSIRVVSTTLTIILAFTSSMMVATTAFHSTPQISCANNNALRASLQTPTPETQITPPSPSTTNSVPLSHHDGQATTPTMIQSAGSASSHVLSIDDMNPIFKFNKNGKEKVLNATGLYHLFIIVITMPFWLVSMGVLQWLGDNIEGFDENRAKFDYSGKVWCRTYLKWTDCYPEIAGDVARLQTSTQTTQTTTTIEDNNDGACLFVANHASFLDIAVLCCVLDPVFKFIAKDELKKLPGVGKQLVGGEHVLIDRTTKRSQLRTFKQAITYLQNGVPIMAFPEGARSPDGRLMPFKGGIFSMAVKAKVPIVPLSLANTHAVMPSAGFVPVQSGRGKLRVFVHDEISVEGKSEEEIVREVREALLSELPLDQHPLEEEEEELGS
mmetsp:Transcript_19870/g.36511  ORF Transcript_19870/g.36511 Transcript_19870/m.36511 type:complete len:402 (-) Transcript_19870:165-1370(-)